MFCLLNTDYTRIALFMHRSIALTVAPARANVSGAIYTTISDASVVNGNIYASKDLVYLSGGPQNKNDPGLVPDGTYYFQVTHPSGAVLLSTDDITCRQVVVSGGRVVGVPATVPSTCTTGLHAPGTQNDFNGALPVQLIPYADTPNPGGEYKAWMTRVEDYAGPNGTCPTGNNVYGFCDSLSKTDNFKVKKANVAYLIVCKFNDLNGNGTQDSGEPLIPHWPITATGVDGGTVNVQTDDFGCVSFSFSGFNASVTSDTATLTETVLPGWLQTAPRDGTYDANGNTAVSGPATMSGFVETITLNPNDSVTAPNFGNTCIDTSCGGNTVELTVTKDAYPSLTRTFTWGISKSVDKTEVDTSAASATFKYTVSVTHDTGANSGWQVTGKIKVSNPSLVDITGITVTDAVDNGGTCTITDANGGVTETVKAGDHLDVPYTCTYPSLPSSGTNSATAAWDNSSSATGTASVDFSKASIKAVDDSVTVTDTLGGTLGTVSSADPSPTTFTYSHAVAGTAGTCVSQDNTAAFTTNTTGTTGSDSKTVKDCEGADLQVSKKAVASFTSSIAKSVDKTEIDTTSGGSATFNYSVKVTESGWKVSGNIAVTNPNDWEAITANLSDALTDTGGTCVINGGTTSVTVAQSSSSSIPYSCTFASAPGAASGSNTVIATWDAVAANTPESSASSGAVSYAFGSLTVTDSFKGALGTITAPAASTTYTYSRTITAPSGSCSTIPNKAAITETSQSSSQSVKVCGGSDLTVSKTATPTFTSTINKTGPASPVEKGGSSALNYNITVAESGWNVAGTITLTNPNDWESITANVTDSLCSVPGSTGVVVAASSSQNLSYSCNLTSSQVLAAASGTNMATASWSGANTPSLSASASKGYKFTTLTITDAFNGANPAKTLGTVAPGTASKTFTDSYTVMVTGGTCVPYPNIATISETGQTSNKTVTVCNTATGALTMGFWQNKNG